MGRRRPARPGRCRAAAAASFWRWRVQRVRDLLVQGAVEFCQLTDMHGYKYIVQPKRHGAERLFWLVAVTSSMAAACYFMADAYAFNRAHQSLLAVDTTHHPLWRVHMPAVTLCPSNKLLRFKALRLIRSMKLPPGVDEEVVLEDMALLPELVWPEKTNVSLFARLQRVLDDNKLGVDRVMRELSPSCDELLVRCVWRGRLCDRCSDLFRKVRTAFGYCCSFNYVDKDLDSFRPSRDGCLGTDPHTVVRLSACGSRNGLSVLARVQPKEYVSSLVPSHSVMVLIHHAYQYPNDNAHIKVVGTGTVSLISYVAQVMDATQRLRSGLLPAVRKCLFSEETYLPMYSDYTFANCMASCKANRTMAVCGCVPLTFPYVLNRTICNLLAIPCQSALSRTPVNRTDCPRCLPGCEHVQYIVKSSSGALVPSPISSLYSGAAIPADVGLHDYALIKVYARHFITTRFKNDLHLQERDLLGSLGGLSGLFVGFSLVAGFECIYVFTIRPCFCDRLSLREPREPPAPRRRRRGLGGSFGARAASPTACTGSGTSIAHFIRVPPRVFTLLPAAGNVAVDSNVN